MDGGREPAAGGPGGVRREEARVPGGERPGAGGAGCPVAGVDQEVVGAVEVPTGVQGPAVQAGRARDDSVREARGPGPAADAVAANSCCGEVMVLSSLLFVFHR